MEKRRLLFIDDDASILNALSRYFEMLGYGVYRATSGREGAALFGKVNPDVTVLDLHLPDLSGLDILERLRRHHATVIMLTGHGEIENAVEAMRRGAENFLTKPIELAHLAVAIEKAIEKVQLQRENVRLRRRLSPNLRKQFVRAAAFVGLATGSALIGSAIGRGNRGVSRVEPPVRIQLADTTTATNHAPLIP